MEKVMAKIQLSQRMYSVNDINRLLESGEMVIQPKYQRRRTAWPLNAKTALIYTMLNNFPIPPVYLRDFVNDAGKRQKVIIDGQQRIATIIEYLNNEFDLSRNISDSSLAGNTYKDLPTEEQLLIEDFEVSFISIRGPSDGDIISIFSRLNSYSLPLNSQEKRNSVYAGEIKSVIYELATEYNTFWTKSKILTEAAISRMADALLVSEIIYTILYGYQSARLASLDKMYREYDENFPYKEEVYDNFNKTMTILGHLFESKHIKNTFKPKFMFYSLFLVIYAKNFGFEGRENEKIGRIDINRTIDALEDFSIRFSRPEFDPVVKNRIKQATGNVAQRKFRHTVISKLVC